MLICCHGNTGISLLVPKCNFTMEMFLNDVTISLMNYSFSARIYPIMDFEVVGTLIYNGLSGFCFKACFHRLLKKEKEGQTI